MNAPRWSSPYADAVREDLVRMVGEAVPTRARRPFSARADRPRWIVTGVVAVLVAVAAVLAIRAGVEHPAVRPATRPSTVASPSPTASARPSAEVAAILRTAVFARLPAGADEDPAQTWTDAIDTAGKTMLLAAACEGGGSLTVTVSGKPDVVLPCSTLSTVGPIDLSAAAGTDPPGGVSFDVAVSAGHPRYLAKAVAVDSASVR